MSGDIEYNLSGEWRGIYNYPALYPANEFEARINDFGGRISGVIREPGDTFDPPGTVQHAVIEGAHQGCDVSFVKIYDELDFPTPHYRGVVQPGGDEIVGEWTIPGDWSGTFLMVRTARAKEAIEREVGETIPVP